MNDIRQRPASALAFMASGIIYFTGEFIAAAAWTDPPYSYTHHFISNLGVHGPLTAFGQYMYSPLASLMNIGLVLTGLAVLTAVTMLKGLPGGRRAATVITAAVLAIGMILVGLFPGDGGTGGTDYHGIGAILAFLSGNVLVILLGRAHQPLGTSSGLGRLLTVAGALGLLSLVIFGIILASGAGVLIGLSERGIIYPFLIGFVLLGAAFRRRRA
ncbi:hypothetical protein GCM10010112_62480 [Actinoplanes lobatus]|uniref:Putative membrane protein n=1 Tax=Actinoplanes lobatus TaxID=113568 RepID=A0A7W7MJ88_9ACTN|nr:DUF998 domain-containing protein [Actinoplanes lobatus]MBB4752208.1 putative membrane protein [Actinoplanes lobatus]GGN83802.1 hypothetical protein GCM10010112_62480 [Actinoplanes lobatus]GIE46021.1 hypothetical protein Alo02nite_89190 [Actinoplanes lobatus]